MFLLQLSYPSILGPLFPPSVFSQVDVLYVNGSQVCTLVALVVSWMFPLERLKEFLSLLDLLPSFLLAPSFCFLLIMHLEVVCGAYFHLLLKSIIQHSFSNFILLPLFSHMAARIIFLKRFLNPLLLN